MERLGIIEEAAERRAKYGRFAYKPPVVPAPADVRPQVIAPPSRVKPMRITPHGQVRTTGIDPTAARIRAREILLAVAEVWETRLDALIGPYRGRSVVWPRYAAYRLIKQRLSYSTPLIGRLIGDRDHTTIMHGLARAKALMQEEPEWRARYRLVEAILDGEAVRHD
jgi:hypothetical protein